MLEHGNPGGAPPDRVVVMGAGGFVGGAIRTRLEADGIAVLALGRAEVDLAAEDAAGRLAGHLQPTDSLVIVSAIAPARNDDDLLANLRMMQAIDAALQSSPVAHVVNIGSDAVYHDDANPVTETACAQPGSLHGVMHLAREVMLAGACGAPLCRLRPSLLYGARDPHNGYGPNRFRRLAAKGETITLFGEGEEMRDHVLIDDLAAVVALCLSHRSSGCLNVATGNSTSFRAVAEDVAARFEHPVAVAGTPRRNPVTHRHFDITACLKAFPGFHFTPLADGLGRAHAEALGQA